MNNNDIKSIIQKSGNNFHCDVLNYFKEKDWCTLISPYYTDAITDKPREIDIITEKGYKCKDIWGKFHGTINVKLYIECKYISNKVVFWFANKDMDKATDWVINNTHHEKISSYAESHHYLKDGKVAKLFASSKQARPENEDIYRALNQCLNAMVYNRRSKSLLPGEQKILSTIEYPVIVCNSFNNFYRLDIEEKKGPDKINENFQLEVNYAYLDSKKKHVNEYFLIDLIDYNKIDEFLLSLDKDARSINNILSMSFEK